jgi:hypothetical protein
MPGMPCRHVPKLDSAKVMKRSYQSVISAFVSVHFGTEGLRFCPVRLREQAAVEGVEASAGPRLGAFGE